MGCSGASITVPPILTWIQRAASWNMADKAGSPLVSTPLLCCMPPNVVPEALRHERVQRLPGRLAQRQLYLASMTAQPHQGVGLHRDRLLGTSTSMHEAASPQLSC
jgi:hypothetical protein